jgi:hypothetical protein
MWSLDIGLPCLQSYKKQMDFLMNDPASGMMFQEPMMFLTAVLSRVCEAERMAVSSTGGREQAVENHGGK